MIARVQYVGSLLEHTFEIEASRIFTEVIKDGYRAEVTMGRARQSHRQRRVHVHSGE